MASTYTINLQIQQPGINDPSSLNLWGGFLNTDFQMIDDAVSGVYALAIAGATTLLTQVPGLAAQNGNQAHYNCTGNPGGSPVLLFPQNKARMFSLTNSLSAGVGLTVGANNGSSAPAGATVLVANGNTVICYSDGVNVATRVSAVGGALLAANNLSDLSNAGTARINLGLTAAATTAIGVSGATIPLNNGNNTFSGNLTLSGTNSVTGVTTFSKPLPAIGAVSTSGAITPTSDSTPQYNVVATGGSISFANPSGTPTNGQRLLLRITDDGSRRSITSWGTAYRAVNVTLPAITTATVMYVGMIYNSTAAKWDVILVQSA